MKWDAAGLRSAYCNLANVRGKDGEVEVSFGVSRSSGQPGAELEVELLHRVILTPAAAKQLQGLLIKLLEDHASREAEAK